VQIDPTSRFKREGVHRDRAGFETAVYKQDLFQQLTHNPKTGGVCTLRIRNTDKRKREWEMLQEATGEKTTSGAIDVAVRYYLKMNGNNAAAPTGSVEELMQLATEQGTVTAPEIADVLDVEELPVEYEQEWAFGRE
jgi:hypothetical protein